MTQTVDYDPFAGAELEQVLAATAAQKEIWAATRFGNDVSCAFNESVSLHLNGALDLSALRQAWNRVIANHEALRGTFSPDDGRFCVAASATLPVPLEDLSSLSPSARQERLNAVLAEEVETPFDLEHGPLVRARLLRLGPLDHWLTLTAHHIVCDGWSMAVVLRDLAHYYSGIVPPRAQPFSEYARRVESRQGADPHQRSLQYWLGRLQGELPVLQLPTDRSHQALRTYRSDRVDHPLAPELVQALKKMGARAGASFFTTLLTAFAAFLQRLTGQQDLIVAMPAAGQSAEGMENVVGHCANLLLIRCAVEPLSSFNECLKQVRAHVLDAYDHQQVTFGEVLPLLKFRRDPSRPPLVAVAFNLDQAVQAKDLPFAGLEVEFHSNPRHYENFELFINASETAGRVVLECQYNTDLFDAETIRDRMESFEVLLAGAAATPDEAIARLPLLSRAQQERILVEWNATALDYPRDQTVARLLHEQAMRTPARPALTFGDTTLSYAELDRRANQLAHHLAAQGAGRGTLVGLCVERSVEMVVAMLAVLKAGAGYVPLDPRYPRERLGFMLTDSRATLVVAQEKWLGLFADGLGRVLCLEREVGAIAAQAETPLPCPARPEDVAYVIYTSGSTGTPKGVAVVHSGVVNLFSSMRQWPGLAEQDVLLAVTTFSFDMSVTEILLPLSVGARVVLASQDATSDGHQLCALLQNSGATVMQATPGTWRMLLQAGWQGGSQLIVWTGGEALAPDLARALLERSRELWNLYGPTETTVYSTGCRVTDPDCIRIGKPIGNSQTYILDVHGRPVPVGVPGELYLGGAGVAAGYLHRPDLTAQRFVENPYHDPFAEYPNPHLYRTGDLARWRRDGTIEYLGRNDQQIKIRGYRIELGEIEATLSVHPAVRQAVVAVRTDRPNDPRLVAYIVPAAGRQVTATEWRKYLRQRLPEQMIPQHFIDLEELPHTSNGKVDRSSLPAPFAQKPRAEEERPRTLTHAQQYVLRVCRELLEDAKVGVEDNFFQSGGHSLMAMQVLSRFEDDTGMRLSPRLLIVHTLGQVAEQLPAERVPVLS